MRALLLYPEFPETFWSFKHALKFIRKRASLPPLGLLTVAAMLPTHWSKRLVDLNVRRLTDRDLAWADIVLISAMIVQRESTRALIARCRAAGKLIVAGGPLFTAEHERFPDVDHLVLDEAELTLPPFLRDLEQGSARRVYRAQEFADLTKTPPPMWELADLGRYATMSVQYSRGCPFDCEFCNVTTLFGRRPRIKAAAQVIAELDGLYQLGWRGISSSSTTTSSATPPPAGRAAAGPDALAARSRGAPFLTESSINLADDPELMAAMVAAGFDTVFVGIETPDESALAECSKSQNRGRDLVADVKRIQRAGCRCRAASSSASTATPRPSSSDRSTSSRGAASSPPWSGCCRRCPGPSCTRG